MSTAPFSPETLATLSRLSAEINPTAAPPSITCPVVLNEDGFVTVPVPNHEAHDVIGSILGMAREMTMVSCQLHAGLTLQWAPMPGGLLLELRGEPAPIAPAAPVAPIAIELPPVPEPTPFTAGAQLGFFEMAA